MPIKRERQSVDVQSERVVVAAVRLPDSRHDPADPFGELRSLAEQAGATVVGELSQARERPEAGTYMGKGKVEELKALCEALNAGTIIFDHDLSPRQIANIEEATERKVLDRSELILDIFASRATTHEARLQVELAQLEYTYPRLRAMWDHLERIVGRGGIGGIGTKGPGEQQLEIDRRLVQRRREQLTADLRVIQARKRREVTKRRAEHFTVGIVGYTNAGKSTLFNTLTEGGAYADDRLFATLITRTREWNLGGGVKVMLSDTVGFVRDLPHNLVASFRATLEEATHADILLVVLDVSDPAAELQHEAVASTLEELFAEVAAREEREGEPWRPPDQILLLNKADRLRDNRELLVWTSRFPDALPICALDPQRKGTGEGLDELRRRVRDLAAGEVRERRIALPLRDPRGIAALERQGEVIDREYDDSRVVLTLRIGDRQVERLNAGGVRMEMISDEKKSTPARRSARSKAIGRKPDATAT